MTKASRLLTIILWIILAVSAVLIVSLMVNISDNNADSTMGGWINTNLVWTYILMIIGAGIALLAGLYQMVTNISSAKKSLISLAAIAVVAVVAYSLASNEIPQFFGVEKFVADGTLTPNIAKIVDTGLIATYLLFGGAILAIVWSSISQVFK
jgi:FlaA1/EpsC-like NDP-sugar epimerase